MRMLSIWVLVTVTVSGPANGGINTHADGEAAAQRGEMIRQISHQLNLMDAETGIQKCGLPAVAYAVEYLYGDARAFLDRPVRQKNILRGLVRVHYDTTGVHTPAMLNAQNQRIPGTADEFADSVASIANHVIQFETSVLGYPAAPGDGLAGGGNEYDIYVEELGNLYGATYWDAQIAPRRYTTYMVIDNDFIFVVPDSNKGLPGLRVTIAHEYHHAIQIGNYGLWGFEHLYFYEMTSVWMEDLVYTEVNDYYAYLRSSQGHFRRPELPFTSTDFVMYSRGIWCHFLAKRFDGTIVQRAWEHIIHSPPLPALNTVLQLPQNSSSFRTAFLEWTLWNYFTGPRHNPDLYYDEGEFYPEIMQKPSGFSPPFRVVADSLSAFSARYHQILYNADTLILAISNLNIDDATAGTGGVYPYSYSLASTQVDPAYTMTTSGIFYKLQTPDPTNWHTWGIVNGGVAPAPLREAVPFPNPFFASGNNSVFIPVSSTEPVEGTLTIFSSSMGHVYSATGGSSLLLGRHVFGWNGRTDDGKLALSGVYLFVLELPNQMLKGKLALMRE